MSKPAFDEIPLPPEVQSASAADYARLPDFVGSRQASRAVLSHLRIGIIGAGSVGRAMALDSARLSPAAMLIVDPGQLKSTSYLTHPCVLPGEGENVSKARDVGRLVKRLTPRTHVAVCETGVESLDETAFAEADAVLLATDNLPAEIEAARRSQQLGFPLIQASLMGEMLVVQVRCFAPDSSGAPTACPVCQFSPLEWRLAGSQIRFSCEGSTTGRDGRMVASAPTMTPSFLCGIAGSLGVLQMLKLALKLGPSPGNTLLEFCGYTGRTTVSPLKWNPDCPIDHTRLERVAMSRPISGCTLAELATAAGFTTRPDDLAFSVQDRVFAGDVACLSCRRMVPVRRFIQPQERDIGPCRCGGPLPVDRFFVHRPVPAAVTEAVMDVPLAQLGAETAAWAILRGGRRSVLLFNRRQQGQGV